MRLCSKHGKMRDQSKTYQLPNGGFACKRTYECRTGTSQSIPGKEGTRASQTQQRRADPSLRPPRSPRRSRGRSRSRSRGRRGHRHRASGSPARPRHPSPEHTTLSSPLAIAVSLFDTMDTNPAKLTITSDGFYRLKDLMNTWGRKHRLSTEEVLSAIACSLFKVMKKVDRANFLVWQNDDADADILLSIPVPSVRWLSTPRPLLSVPFSSRPLLQMTFLATYPVIPNRKAGKKERQLPPGHPSRPRPSLVPCSRNVPLEVGPCLVAFIIKTSLEVNGLAPRPRPSWNLSMLGTKSSPATVHSSSLPEK